MDIQQNNSSPTQTPATHQSSDERYLAQLNFNPELRKSFLNFFVVNFRVVLLMIMVLTGVGLYAFATLPRESNPEVKIPIAVVTTVYPGASPADVEEFVTKKVETAVAGLKGVKKITSNSANSFSSVTVEFDAREDLDDAIRRLKDKVTTLKTTLTTDAKEPQVTEISLDDQPVWTIVVTGPYDGFALRKYAETIQDEIEKVPGVREVNISGGDQKEYQVAYDPQRLLFYGVSADQANQAIAATNLAIPAGNFEGARFVYPVRSDGRLYGVRDIENVPITHTDAGAVVFIKDVATVTETAIKRSSYARLSIDGSQPQNAVTLSLIKRSGASVIETVAAARTATDAAIAQMPPGITYDVSQDFSKLIERDFNRLTHDFLLTVLLVFVILFLIVGLKEALVAGLAIPLVFFATFAALKGLGISLNFLSLFGLILSLGLLVDDAIVVVSATKQYLRSGKFTPEEAVLLVLNDFKVVLFTTTLTTVWAFLPLLFATGIIGQYIRSIPVTVSITLISSLFIALMINHPLAAVLERVRLTRHNFVALELALLVVLGTAFAIGGWWGFGIGIALTALQVWLIVWYEKGGRENMLVSETLMQQEWASDERIKEKLRLQSSAHHETSFLDRLMHGILKFDRFIPLYEQAMRWIMATKPRRVKTVLIVSGVFLVSLILPATGLVQTIFFPDSDQDFVFIDVQAPTGLRLEETDAIVRRVEEQLVHYPEIANFATITGRPSAASGQASFRDTSNTASITIVLKEKDQRSITSYDFATVLRDKLQTIGGATIKVTAQQGGPPTGAAFQAQIAGDNLETITRIAHDLRPKLASIPGVINVDISLKDSAPDYTFVLDPQALERNSLNAAYVGSALRMAISGSEISTIIQDNKEIKIQARFDTATIPTLAQIQNLQIVNLRKQSVFLKDVARVELKPSVDAITRINQKRTIVLSSGADASTNSNLILTQFQKNISDYRLPPGYTISYGGQNEQNAESVVSIIEAMVIAMALIVATLIVQFNSFRKAFIVLVTIPLALIGVFFGMAFFNVALSFPGLIGILALFGIVVKNAIILVDKMNLNLKSGIPFFEAIVDAGKSRLEAIFITSICTIFGILPITLSDETWTSLGGAIIFGLSLSSFLTLFFVPLLFFMLVKPTDHFTPAQSEEA